MSNQFKLANQPDNSLVAEKIRVRGKVGDFSRKNVKVIGTPISIDTFMQRLQTECPPLAKITAIIRRT